MPGLSKKRPSCELISWGCGLDMQLTIACANKKHFYKLKALEGEYSAATLLI
jgi:hypothetical protein